MTLQTFDRSQSRRTKFVAMIGIFLMIISVGLLTLSSAKPAAADVPNGSITHVFLDLGTATQGNTLASRYQAFIVSLRNAAGHEYRNGVLQTQTQTTNRLIRVDVNTDTHHLRLWLTPNNLYVRGFQTDSGAYWQFADSDYDLLSTLAGFGANALVSPAIGVAQTGRLSFGSNYNSMAQWAGRGRDAMGISLGDLRGSVNQLAGLTSPFGNNAQATARSLMFMIQFTSESARFWDVYGVVSDTMSRNATYSGLPLRQQYLENAWDQISSYAYRVSQNPSTSPVNVTGVGTLRSFSDVQPLMAQIIGSTSQVSSTGNWDHTEL